MDAKHCAVGGWVDAIPAPGPRDTATFDLIVPTDLDAVEEDIHDTVGRARRSACPRPSPLSRRHPCTRSA
ncbi:hypothetical protein [Streptomyces sp. NRRL F-5065]|uniref:hypothetical protein n=1 Tax=Streptomyces sp. NRRL F-5065 TaxID=1463855 RepID=UPI0004C14697|nr:hypothetical protein [Streptomyces sp. NRRL F-5065]